MTRTIAVDTSTAAGDILFKPPIASSIVGKPMRDFTKPAVIKQPVPFGK